MGTADKKRDLLEPLKDVILKLKSIDKECAELEYVDNADARSRVRRTLLLAENEIQEMKRKL